MNNQSWWIWEPLKIGLRSNYKSKTRLVQDGNQLVDLGPVDSLKVTLTPKTKIVVHGVPVRMQDHQVVLAEQIDLDGHSHSIPRWK